MLNGLSSSDFIMLSNINYPSKPGYGVFDAGKCGILSIVLRLKCAAFPSACQYIFIMASSI